MNQEMNIWHGHGCRQTSMKWKISRSQKQPTAPCPYFCIGSCINRQCSAPQYKPLIKPIIIVLTLETLLQLLQYIPFELVSSLAFKLLKSIKKTWSSVSNRPIKSKQSDNLNPLPNLCLHLASFCWISPKHQQTRC